MNKIGKLLCEILTLSLVITFGPINVGAENSKADNSLEQMYEDEGLFLPTGDVVLDEMYEDEVTLSDADFEVEDYSVATTKTQKSAVKNLTQKSSFWDKYSSKYYYNKLSSKEKALWRNLDKVCKKYLTTTANARKANSRYFEYGTVYAENSCSISSVRKVWEMFTYNNPQYYFIGSSLTWASGGVSLKIEKKYANGAKRAVYTEKMREQIVAWEEEVNLVAKTKLEKILQYAEILCDEVQYDYNYDNIKYNQTTASAILNKKTVCAGYAKAFTLLARGEGYNVMTALSNSHAWNIIKYGDKWYILDATFADQKTWIASRYFLTSTNAISTNNSHTVVSELKKYTPKCKYEYNDRPMSTMTGPVFANSGCKVKLKSASSNQIYYTTDGTTPTPENAILYDGTFTVEDGTVVKAASLDIGYDGEYSSSRVACDVVHNLEAPMLNSLSVTNDGMKISWGTVIGATKYVVYRKTDDGDYEKIKTTSSKSYTDKTVEKGHLYTYTVAGKDDADIIGGYNKSGLKKIYLKGVSISSVKGGKSSLTVKWKKLSKAEGYQISYSTSKSFSSSKTIDITDADTVSKKITSLKKGKTYYVRIRGSKVINEKTYYGPWGKVKSVKVK